MTTKKVIFEEHTDQHARMITRLRYDQLTQGNFFRGLVELYVNNDIDMAKIISKIKQSRSTMGKRRIQRSLRDIRKGEQVKHSLGLSDKERKFVYDLIEEDFEEQ